MEVQKIDEIFVMFNGEKFRKDKRNGYYWTVNVPRKSLHLSVFEFHGGKRLNGYELHHVDFNKENNDVLNIISIPIAEHKKIHTEQRKEKYGNSWNAENIKKAHVGRDAWHKTESYKQWLKDTSLQRSEWGRKSNENKIKIDIKCEYCGKIFKGRPERIRNICSNRCWQVDRRKKGVNNVEKNCIICNKIFTSDKYQKIQTCSGHCRSILSYSNRVKN